MPPRPSSRITRYSPKSNGIRGGGTGARAPASATDGLPNWLASPSLSRHFGQSPCASAGISAPHSRHWVAEVMRLESGDSEFILPDKERFRGKGYGHGKSAKLFGGFPLRIHPSSTEKG